MFLYSRSEQERLLAVLQDHHRDLLRFFTGIHYLDIGYRFRQKKPLPELSLRIHVHQKLPLHWLSPAQILPLQIEGLRVDVIQSNPELQHLTADRDQRFDPLPAGVAIANTKLKGIGTLGAIVYDQITRTPMGLSAHHVLVGNSGQFGDAVAQPASKAEQDIVGNLSRWDREFDCAVFQFNRSRSLSESFMGVSESLHGDEEPLVGMRVVKSGRTTGVTYGIIDGVNEEGFTIIPDPTMPAPDGEISLPGDSGAVWLETKTGMAVGLHVAGEANPDPADERAWAKRITRVLNALNITMKP